MKIPSDQYEYEHMLGEIVGIRHKNRKRIGPQHQVVPAARMVRGAVKPDGHAPHQFESGCNVAEDCRICGMPASNPIHVVYE